MFVELFDDIDLNHKFNHMIKCTLKVDETLDMIIEKKMSVARYGDGEIKMTTSLAGCMFENSSYYVTSKLRTILQENHNNLLVCIPGDMRDSWWSDFWQKEFSNFSNFLIKKVYGHSFVSRAAFRQLGQVGVEKWKKVWDNRKVVFVTGSGSRFNYKHELFDNLNDYNIVSSTATHATRDIPRLVSELSMKDKDTLFLLALGPAATILAYELSLLGFQAIDIGHITNCYDSVFNGAIAPEKLPVRNNILT